MNIKFKLSSKILLSLLVLFPTVYLLGESFVVPRNKKAPSASKLKEQCCEECAAILELTPELLRVIADVHQTALSNLRSYIDDGKEGFIATKSKAQLAASHDRLVALRTNLESLSREIKQCQSFLEVGYQKVGVTPAKS